MSLRIRKRLFKHRRFRQLIIGLVILAIWLGMLIVVVERSHPNARITTWFDGLYWAVSTVSTVGYGDLVPVTIMGKWISIILQLIGALMFGLVIAIASAAINRSQDEFYWNRLFERLDRIEDEITDLRRRSSFMVKTDQEPEADQSDEDRDESSRNQPHD